MAANLLDVLFTRWGIGLYAVIVLVASVFYPGVVFVTIGLFALLLTILWRINLETALGLLPFEFIALVCAVVGYGLSYFIL
ncbi:MAG: hypothetical protein CMF61_02615 [Magnetococcales bacterium]|nr:hypothetical protein [Magnetococcales bacterium]PPR19684.1 MAG: hypothetical protein CFH43_00048 [Pseudomonadota bacterium]